MNVTSQFRRRLPITLSLSLALALFPWPAQAQVVPAPSAANSALPSPLTLDQALSIALRLQPQNYIAQAQTTQALGAKQEAAAAYFPTLTPSYQFQSSSRALYGIVVPSSSAPQTVVTTGTTGTTTGTTGGTTTTGTTTTGTSTGTSGTVTGTGVRPLALPRASGGGGGGVNEVSIVRGGGLTAALTQTLFDSGQRELNNAQARRAVEAARYGETNTREQVILTVTQDFYNLLRALDLVKVANSQVARYRQALEVTQAQAAAGTTAGKDVFQAQADFANAQVTLLQDQGSVLNASAALKDALGVETTDPVTPAPLAPGDQLPPLPPDTSPGSLDDLVRRALAARPDLRQQQAQVAGSDSAVKVAEIEAGLSVSTTFALTYQATNDLGNRGLDTQLLVNGSYPLFDAGHARGAVRVARGQRDATLDQLALVRQGVRQDVEQAYSTRAVALQATRLAQAAIQAAQVNYDAAAESRREGVGTVIDVTTAEATLTQAQNQYVSSIYDFYTADASLRRAVGGNDLKTERQ